MTILENDVIPLRKKLPLSKRRYQDGEPVKRKYHFEEETSTAKRQLLLGEMLNGYRGDQRNNGDILQDSPVAVLSNMGNTCFFNSVLYTLRFAPTFLHNLHHLISDLAVVNARLNQNKAKTSSLGRNVGSIMGPGSRSTSSKDLLSLGSSNDFIPKSKVQIVTEKLHELFMTMHNLEIKESTDPYQPIALLQAIREANSIFEGNNQQDAHELLVYLLDNIRETCDVLTHHIQQNPDLLNEIETISSVNSSKIWNVRRSWKKSLKKKDKNTKESISEEQTNGASNTDVEETSSNDSTLSNKRKLGYNFVAEDFEGITLRRTKCLECESVTERKEPFYDIPVPIPLRDDDEDQNPNDIFRKACVTTEKLCDSNKYLCETCDRYNEASREVLFEKLPNIMVLQLKRFTTSSTGVQKVNTYLPTPLDLKCFCENCTQESDDRMTLPHKYQLCCVIMHLGGAMASGHYIAYVRAADHFEDYADCTRDLPKSSLSASSSEKSLNILKYLKPKTLALGGSLIENRNGLSSKSIINGVRMCKSVDCCGVKINKNVVENVINSFSKKTGQDYLASSDTSNGNLWLECDDENVRPITQQELIQELAFKPNSTSTPYLLFYSKVTDATLE